MALSAEALGGRIDHGQSPRPIGELPGLRRLAILRRDGTPIPPEPEKRPEGAVVFLTTKLGERRIKVHDPHGVISVGTPNVVFETSKE